MASGELTPGRTIATQGSILHHDPHWVPKMILNGVGGSGSNGVRVLAARSVEFQAVSISGFSTVCVDVQTAATATQIRFEGSTLSGCPTGLLIQTTAAVPVTCEP